MGLASFRNLVFGVGDAYCFLEKFLMYYIFG